MSSPQGLSTALKNVFSFVFEYVLDPVRSQGMFLPGEVVLMRQVCHFFRHIITFDRVHKMNRVKRPENMELASFVAKYKWFLQLPGFADVAISKIEYPRFRVRGSVSRLLQGFLRSLHCESQNEGMALVATVQPSQEWSDKHEVTFLFKKGFLHFKSCKCVNGYEVCSSVLHGSYSVFS